MKKWFFILIVLALQANVLQAQWTCEIIPPHLTQEQDNKARNLGGWASYEDAQSICGPGNVTSF